MTRTKTHGGAAVKAWNEGNRTRTGLNATYPIEPSSTIDQPGGGAVLQRSL